MSTKTFKELNELFKNNLFREIDQDVNSTKFYLLKSISKKDTLKKFCKEFELKEDLDQMFNNDKITNQIMEQFIKNNFSLKTNNEMIEIEKELNQMMFFDWGGSFENNLKKILLITLLRKQSLFKKLIKI